MKEFIRRIFRKKYEPKKFWDNWAFSFMDDAWQVKVHSQHTWFLKIIKHENPKSILEVGCGFGRNIKYMIDNGIEPSTITGLDISPKMIKLAKKYVDNKKVKLQVSDITTINQRKTFDLVLVHGVLMHIPESKIQSAINNIIKLTKKSLILIEQNYEVDNNYTFMHDYKSLLSSAKIDIIEYRSEKKLGLDLIYAEIR